LGDDVGCALDEGVGVEVTGEHGWLIVHHEQCGAVVVEDGNGRSPWSVTGVAGGVGVLSRRSRMVMLRTRAATPMRI
jgi:hypothetical protein